MSHNPRPMAGPQSACNSIRRKSTATVMEYLAHMDDPAAFNGGGSPSLMTTPGRQSYPQRHPLQQHQQRPPSSSVLSTPERPLLTDFGGSAQHIYMEVDHQQPPPPPPPANPHYQPIQIPILMEAAAATVPTAVVPGSSNSSQSSGYYSEFHNQHQQQRSRDTPPVVRGVPPPIPSSTSRGLLTPKNGSPAPRISGGVVNAGCTAQQLEIQDSQII